MPLFKGVASKSTPLKALGYITNPNKAKYVSARNLFEDENFAKQFQDTMKRFGKGKKRNERKYYHFKLSPSRKDNADAYTAHVYSRKISEAHISRKKEIEITPRMKLIDGRYFVKNDDVIRKSFGKYDKSMDRRCFYEELIQYKGEKKKVEVDAKLTSGEYFFEEKNGMHMICEYLPIEGARAKLYSIIKVLSEEGKKELNSLGISTFDYPKPLALLQQLCDINNNHNSIILDFFAGSGTTGHAVMKLNAEDGGSRKFILCTNNENNICRDVTYERIKRVIEKEDYKASLKYFKVEFVPISEKLYYEYADELLAHIRELVELENGINFNGNTEIAIILTEDELDNFTANIPNCCKAIYLGHDVLSSDSQEKLFKEHGIAVNIIPDYYYRELEG